MKSEYIIEAGPERVYFIGDVHGCSEELDSLCSRIYKDDRFAVIVQLGDVIDRGPHLHQVFEVLNKHYVITVMGNHEYNFLREVVAGTPCRSKDRQNTISQFDVLSDTEQAFIISSIQRMVDYVKIQGPSPIFGSHSIPRNDYFMTAQRTTPMLCMNSDTDVSHVPKRFTWFHGHQHWAYKDIDEQITNKLSVINVDSGCVYGHELIAVRADLKVVYREPALKVYCNNFTHN